MDLLNTVEGRHITLHYSIMETEEKLNKKYKAQNMRSDTKNENAINMKIHMRQAVGRGYFTCICVYLFVSRLLAKQKTIQIQKDRKITMSGGLSHISSITLL